MEQIGGISRQNNKKGSQKQLGHPLTLEAFRHGKHLHFKHIVGKNKEKETNPNETPKTPMSSTRQQNLTRGEKLGGRPKGNQFNIAFDLLF
jgi:hypothetical protein